MNFSEHLKAICDQTLVIRTGLVDALWDAGYEDDVVIRFNLKTGEVTPLTYEDTSIPFYAGFWGAIRMVLAEFASNEFQIEMRDSQAAIYSDYDLVEDNPFSAVLTRETVLEIFKEAVMGACASE